MSPGRGWQTKAGEHGIRDVAVHDRVIDADHSDRLRLIPVGGVERQY